MAVPVDLEEEAATLVTELLVLVVSAVCDCPLTGVVVVVPLSWPLDVPLVA